MISYNKLIYKIIEKKDKDSLIYISQMHEKIKENPNLAFNIDEDYLKYINFEKEGGLVDFTVECEGVGSDETTLYVKFSEKIDYISQDFEHRTYAKLLSDNETHPLDVNDNVISIPLDLLKDRNNLKIKMFYSCDNFNNESYLKNNRRRSISFADMDIDIGIGIDRLLIIDYINRNDNEIRIKEAHLKEDKIDFKATSLDKISEIFIKNVVTFKTKEYAVTYNGNDFSFSIPFKDIMSSPVKKWELNSYESINSIKLDYDVLTYDLKNKITLSNVRNKILISNSLCNTILELHELNKKNDILIDENKDLKNENNNLHKENQKLAYMNNDLRERNRELRDLVNAYKSRKIVKIADKLKR